MILQILVGQNLKLLGQVAMLVVRVLLLAMTGYLLVGLSRISEAKGNSVVYGPLLETLRPSWMKIFKGKAWMDAMIFVIQSLELGTLVQVGSLFYSRYLKLISKRTRLT